MLRFIIGFLLFILFSGQAFAHSPYLIIGDNEDGTVDISGGYSNGQSAAGTTILLKSKETGKILWQGRLDKYGDLAIIKQQEPYVIIFDGGPGHTLEKDGPYLTVGHVTPVTPVTQIYPLQDDFEYVQDILPVPLMIQDPSGVIRCVPIMQGYRYHHGKGLEKIIERLEEKRKAKGGKRKVDLEIGDVNLCFGVTSGYLSLKFAIHELYGREIPKADDFKIMAKGKMPGIWDMYFLYFGREIERKDMPDFNQKGFIFVAERPSTGKRIVFRYNMRVFPELNKLILARKNPEKFKNVDFKSFKIDVIKKLFSIKDFSYFSVINR